MRDLAALPPAAVALASILDQMDPTTKAEQGWKLDAACLTEPLDLFFVDRGQSAQAAKLICSTCPVKIACLRYAIENRIRDGVWGGVTEKQLRRLIKDFEEGTPVEALVVPLPKHGCGCDECNALGQRAREVRSA